MSTFKKEFLHKVKERTIEKTRARPSREPMSFAWSTCAMSTNLLREMSMLQRFIWSRIRSRRSAQGWRKITLRILRPSSIPRASTSTTSSRLMNQATCPGDPQSATKKDAIYVRVWFPTSNVIVKADLLKFAAFVDDFEMVALLSFLQRNIGQVAYFVPIQRSPKGLSTLITMSSSTPLKNWCSPMPSSPPSRCFIKRRC